MPYFFFRGALFRVKWWWTKERGEKRAKAWNIQISRGFRIRIHVYEWVRWNWRIYIHTTHNSQASDEVDLNSAMMMFALFWESSSAKTELSSLGEFIKFPDVHEWFRVIRVGRTMCSFHSLSLSLSAASSWQGLKREGWKKKFLDSPENWKFLNYQTFIKQQHTSFIQATHIFSLVTCVHDPSFSLFESENEPSQVNWKSLNLLLISMKRKIHSLADSMKINVKRDFRFN